MAGSQIVPVRLSPEVVAQLDRRAALESLTRSDVLRSAIDAYLSVPAAVAAPELDARIARISERYGVERLEVFGSTVRGDADPGSDIDILYSLKPGVRLGWAIEDLAAELGDVLGRPVDLVSRKALHPRMRDAVLAEAEVLYAT